MKGLPDFEDRIRAEERRKTERFRKLLRDLVTVIDEEGAWADHTIAYDNAVAALKEDLG